MTAPSPSSEVERLIEEAQETLKRAVWSVGYPDRLMIQQLTEALATQSARLRCCEEALRPFAAYAEGFDVAQSDELPWSMYSGNELFVGDFRRAAHALNPQDPPTDWKSKYENAMACIHAVRVSLDKDFGGGTAP